MKRTNLICVGFLLLGVAQNTLAQTQLPPLPVNSENVNPTPTQIWAQGEPDGKMFLVGFKNDAVIVKDSNGNMFKLNNYRFDPIEGSCGTKWACSQYLRSGQSDVGENPEFENEINGYFLSIKQAGNSEERLKKIFDFARWASGDRDCAKLVELTTGLFYLSKRNYKSYIALHIELENLVDDIIKKNADATKDYLKLKRELKQALE